MLKNKFTSFFPDKPKAALLKAKEIFERYQKSVAKKIVNIVLTATAVFLAVTLVFVLYAKITNKSILSRRILWVMTSSMETTIPARSYILARDIDPADVRVGDVIAFYSSDPTLAGQLNTHRVVEIIGDHEAFRTKGDANPLEDKYSVKPEDVLARYERNMPFLSILGRVYSSLLGFILILLFVMSRTVVWCIQTLKKAESEERDDEIERRIAEEIKKLESGDIQALISTGEYALVRVSSQKQDDESEPEAETPIPAEEPAAEEPLPMEEPVEEEPVPAEEPVTEEPLPMEEPVEEEPVPVKEPATEELLPVEEPAEEEPLPVE
ncbi:MAG: signal peptidase I, partial [Ruminococcus sp.]|nr:signal peptidase I [Candidatus Apopatosoma intestinale]